ncbi:YhdP family protein [Catenovulum sp. 2E275]|uniref:YhdP family protein n=1 Tax=Catenovulum sp. 2E275 TaxID=2980497 RepID=UPI0021CFFB2A|nr:YhdP family protein [Catenovulum sp. 2E275]MCU4676579.1 YhdP family protein [Catenovulum sp. 2E275]
MKVKSLLSSIIRKLWLGFAIVLVTVALLLSAIRISLPYANDFKDELSVWFEQEFNQPIRIESLTADWRGLGPQIEMIGFEFERQDAFDSPVIVNIKQVNLELDFWQTLLQRSFVVKNFVLDGVEVLVDIDKLDAAKESGDNFAVADLFQEIFLEQFRRFDVQDSFVTIITPDQAAHQIKVHQLKWFNRGNTHQGVGDFSLEGIEEDKLGFILDLTDSGDETYSGEFYVKSDGIDLAPWFKPYLAKRVRDIQSRLKFEAWLNIENSELGAFLLNFDPSPMSWYLGNQLQQFELVSGQVQANLKQNTTSFYIDDISFAVGEQLWAGLNLSLTKQDQSWQVYSPEVILNPYKAIASLFPLPLQASQFLNALNGEPSVENFHFSYTSKDDWRLHANLIDLNWQEVLSLPQLTGLSAEISARPGSIVSNWHLAKGELVWQQVFNDKLQVESANIQSIIHYHDSNWRINLPKVQLALKEFELNAALSLQPDDQQELQLSAYGELGQVKVTDVERLLPKKLIGEETFNYLKQGLQGGVVEHSQLIWQGKLIDYPFINNKGIFEAQLSLRDALFQFQPDWPAANDIDLKLTFKNQGLFFESQQAKLLGAQLLNLKANIADLTSPQAELQLSATAEAQGEQATQIMLQSSLKDSVGNVLEQAQVRGLVKLNLDLLIPLHNSQNLNASGEVLFNQNTVSIVKTGFEFQRVNGLLEFNMDKLKARKMTFDWGPVPYQMDINSRQLNSGYQLQFDLRGDWPLDAILAQADFLNMADRLKGSAHVDGHLEILFGANDSLNYRLDVASDLHGVTLKLPQPFDKNAEQLRITNLMVAGDDESAIIELTSGNNISFSSVLPYELAKFSRAYLVLGEDVLSAPGTGFNISAHLRRVNFIDYVNFINDLNKDLSKQESTGEAMIDLPERIRGQVDFLELGPLTWHATNFDVQRSDGYWHSKVFADEFRGEINAFDNWDKQGLNISAEQLLLTLNKAEAQTEKLDEKLEHNVILSAFTKEELREIFAAIPPTKFSCEQCQLDDKNLGKVSFDISRASPNDLLLNNFKLDYRQHKINASGAWRLDNLNRSTTQIKGKINSSDFGHWLRDYQLTSAIRDSSIDADFELNWPQAPMDIGYQYLNGNINIRLGEGYLTEVSDKGARLLSVLSLDSLVRKLKLDFRDVFSKGLFYNQMKGSIKLTNGLAYTDNTTMDGVAGNMEIKGSTDLVSQKINYDIRFSPKITSSLPVLIAWMVNPVTGIAALAIDQVIESADVISQIKFKISGTIDNPQVVETARESREVKLPKKAKSGNKQ